MKVTRTMRIGWALVIFTGAVWLYWPAIRGGFLTGMDDDEYLRQAARLNGLTWSAVQWAFTSTQPYYHPLPRLSHVLDYQIWGTNAAGHHLTSVALHALNAALVFGFLWTLLAAVPLKETERLVMTLGVAIVFAIHPLQVESVAWISGRTQLLCASFGIGCLWAYAAGLRRWLVWTLFVAALLSKPTAVSLLLAMLAIDYFPLRRHTSLGWGQLIREKTVLITLGAATAAAAIFTESHAGGLMLTLKTIPASQRVGLTMQSLTFYPWKLVWPAWLSPYYPFRPGFSPRMPPVFAAALGVSVVTALSIWLRKCVPALVASWAAYVAFVLPISGLMQTGGQAVADRYAYTAMLPLLLLAAGAGVRLWRHCGTAVQLSLVCFLVCELGYFEMRTLTQISVWHDDETLWKAVLVQFPKSHLAMGMLGRTFLDENRIPEALECWQRTVELAPGSGSAHNNLGIALSKSGDLERAIAEYQQALRIDPNDAEAQYNLAFALGQLGRIQEAISHYEDALRIDPNLPDAHFNLGVALERVGNMHEAISHYQETLRIAPNYPDAQNRLARLSALQ